MGIVCIPPGPGHTACSGFFSGPTPDKSLPVYGFVSDRSGKGRVRP